MNQTLKVMPRQVAFIILQVGAVKFGEFRLKLHEKNPDAPLSPFFFNLRTPDNPKPGPLDEQCVYFIAMLFYQMAKELGIEYDRICGVPRAGEPFAREFAKIAGLPENHIITLDKEETASGRKIGFVKSGDIKLGGTVLLLDDLITGADSKNEAVTQLESAGMLVSDVIVLIDREQRPHGGIFSNTIPVHAAFPVRALLGHYLFTGDITLDEYDRAMTYIENERFELISKRQPEGALRKIAESFVKAVEDSYSAAIKWDRD